MKVTIEIDLTDEELKWLDEEMNILFHCCGQGDSGSETHETIQTKFKGALTEVLEARQ